MTTYDHASPTPDPDAADAPAPQDATPREAGPDPGTEAADAVRARDECHDRLLRVTAEFDNYRKRVERERREHSEYTVGEIFKELLPVLDDFHRALATSQRGSGDALREGVELIRKQLLDVMAKRGVTVIDPLGETFDPHLHEAVARTPATGHHDGEIVEVFGLGYRLGERLLRPAMVKVATQ